MLGTMQSGLPDLRFADLLGDTRLVEEARKIAEGQAMGEYKQEVTKKIVLGAIGLVFTVLGFIAGPALLRWLQ